MNIVVCIKQTVDTEAAVSADAEGRLLADGQTLVIDPYSEFAVERAVQLVEEHGGEAAVVCIGGDEAWSARSTCRPTCSRPARGRPECARAPRPARASARRRRRPSAPHRRSGSPRSRPWTARGARPAAPRLAVLLGLPCVGVATALAVDPAAGTARVTREIDDGVAVVEVPLPAVVTAQQGLAEPRYPNVRAIMQSKKKPVTVWTLADLGVEAADAGAEASRTRVLRYRAKPARQGGRIVEGETVPEAVAATVELLATEAKVW